MTTFILVRHGESCANRDGIFAGHFDVELEQRGIDQAQKTANYIYENFKVDKIYSSDLKRAYNTGKYIAKLFNLNIIPDKDFREICAGKWEGIKFNKIIDYFEDDYTLWLSDVGNAHCTDGESVHELRDRVMNKLHKLAIENDGKVIVITTHATPIRAIQCMIQTGSLDNMKNVMWVSNASVSVLEYINGEWEYKQIGYDEHLKDIKCDLPANV